MSQTFEVDPFVKLVGSEQKRLIRHQLLFVFLIVHILT